MHCGAAGECGCAGDSRFAVAKVRAARLDYSPIEHNAWRGSGALRGSYVLMEHLLEAPSEKISAAPNGNFRGQSCYEAHDTNYSDAAIGGRGRVAGNQREVLFRGDHLGVFRAGDFTEKVDSR